MLLLLSSLAFLPSLPLLSPLSTSITVPTCPSPHTSTCSMRGRTSSTALNVLGQPLKLCCSSPRTGYFRDGFCHTGPSDTGKHMVCAEVTDAFLQYSRTRGNDLITPAPQYGFPGLKQGDRWCLCVERWKEALQANVAPRVVLQATHEKAVESVTLETLRKYAVEEIGE